ncbi:hypothetical protein HPG69_008987 [Diceros bicornis minor]|uniref:Uncharacterized protein n=1 Tax=Diceros bicornis minor TaxID=77932 RepID=A0A7J7EC99_DICBM|nr:hypothetical protein HPG69_008987 [Diceros bicornis minor]
MRGGAPAAAGSAVRTPGATVAAVASPGGPAALRGVRGPAGRSDLARGWPRLSLPRWVLDSRGRGDMEPSPATGGSETTRLVSSRDRGGAGGGLRLKR